MAEDDPTGATVIMNRDEIAEAMGIDSMPRGTAPFEQAQANRRTFLAAPPIPNYAAPAEPATRIMPIEELLGRKAGAEARARVEAARSVAASTEAGLAKDASPRTETPTRVRPRGKTLRRAILFASSLALAAGVLAAFRNPALSSNAWRSALRAASTVLSSVAPRGQVAPPVGAPSADPGSRATPMESVPAVASSASGPDEAIARSAVAPVTLHANARSRQTATEQRRAIDRMVEGDYAGAVILYRSLADGHRESVAYAEAARILSDRARREGP
jgi:hypothetical protein